jgi:peptidoglycan/xylan/chitin deacetylase (PgdA/CDA1 family)
MAGKRLQLARSLMAVGAHRVVGRHAPASLLVVNYHRLHASASHGPTRFDDGVFDTDVATFRRQMQWLKAATVVLDEDELLRLGQGGELPRGTLYSAVTFDDGYIDCFSLAKPVLDELGIRGMFFIPFNMLETRRLGWWDVAAYLLKSTMHRSIQVDGQTYDLQGDFAGSLRRILNVFKLEPAERTEALLARLSDACGVAQPAGELQSAELMSWEQVRAMRAAGHGIGSHTISHRVLATLSPEAQADEIKDSKRNLEAILSREVSSFAYPVGGPQHINEHSVRLAREAGYQQAFTFLTGLASLPLADRFRTPRESAVSLEILKAKALLPRVMGIEVVRAANG